MKPIIALFAEVDDDRVTKMLHSYVNAVEKAGGIPVVLPYVKKVETVEGFIELCDGVLFTGGMDIEPQRYGEDKLPVCGQNQLYRDEHEFRAFEIVRSTSLPILAICRGAQLVNVALGGSLYQDIPSEIPTYISHRQTEADFAPSHEVVIVEGTPLYDLVKTKRMTANSFHHQAIKTLGEGLEIMAKADDGVIEGVYYKGDRYLRAYQWHPERLFETEANNRLIFEDFISACKKRSYNGKENK